MVVTRGRGGGGGGGAGIPPRNLKLIFLSLLVASFRHFLCPQKHPTEHANFHTFPREHTHMHP